MDVRIEQIGTTGEELVLIRCREITEEVREIEAFVKSRQGSLSCVSEARQYEIAVTDICYIESVDGKTFLYTNDRVYETAYRLYELEELLRSKQFLRISKPMLVNLMKIQSLQPAFNGRFLALLRSGEKVIISRNYVKALKDALKG
ncbi:MAG: LytTR family transcriptional regulator DNA-binding domain-containing protein [Oscillospiraceae bacterium]|jgi:DNA-binding LytR/AlgR family response regulator|nr:LytTR family transcriptional regulator DNA-binding domain-containing protein [Oscillospiraceae bacterium]